MITCNWIAVKEFASRKQKKNPFCPRLQNILEVMRKLRSTADTFLNNHVPINLTMTITLVLVKGCI